MEAYVLLAQFLFTIITAVVTVTVGIRKIREETKHEVSTLKTDLVNTTLAYERKLTQSDAGLRALLTEMGFFVRDHFVANEVFDKMIEMAAASNENQFKALTESINRIYDKLDVIQADYRRSQS